MEKSFLFGPVRSRRLGISLGVDILPYKTCSYDCIYCELGATTNLCTARQVFYSTDEILRQVENFIRNPLSPRIDVITFAGDGEPTLAKNLGEIIRRIKDITPVPVAVLTNSSLMWMEEVRDELLNADFVLPSIDAVSEEAFKEIDRPSGTLSLETILEGIRKFSRIYTGRLIPEIMIIRGINDNDAEIDTIIEYLKKLNPDRVQLNVVDRYTTEQGVKSPSPHRLNEIRKRFPPSIPVDITGQDPDIFSIGNRESVEEKILAYLSRRPAVPGDLAAALGVTAEALFPALSNLEDQGKIIEIPDRTDNYYYLAG